MICRQSIKAFLANPSTLCSAWAVSARLSARLSCTQTWWPWAAGPDQLCAGQTQATQQVQPCLCSPAVSPGLWHPWLRLTPESCLPALPGSLGHWLLTGAGKVAAHLLLRLSTSTASTSWKQQYFNSTGGAGPKSLAGDTLLPLPLVQLRSCHPAVRWQRTEGVQVILLLVSLTVLRLKPQCHNCLTCTELDSQE